MARQRTLLGKVLLGLFFAIGGTGESAWAQQVPQPGTLPGTQTAAPTGTGGYRLIEPTTPLPPITPGVVILMNLEGKFAEDVSAHGGKAFANWFAEDAVSLSNGKPAARGKAAIMASADWDPRTYMLSWSPLGAEMSPSSDMGYTWGHYIGRATGPDGKQTVTTGRYITVWKKVADGSWKVALDAGAEDVPEPAACCTNIKP